jgi:hypothetical protein
MEIFVRAGHLAGITKRRIAVDDYFAEFLKS